MLLLSYEFCPSERESFWSNVFLYSAMSSCLYYLYVWVLYGLNVQHKKFKFSNILWTTKIRHFYSNLKEERQNETEEQHETLSEKKCFFLEKINGFQIAVHASESTKWSSTMAKKQNHVNLIQRISFYAFNLMSLAFWFVFILFCVRSEPKNRNV